MPIRCPKCGKVHDVVEFEGDEDIHCVCGLKLDVSMMETVEDFLRFFESEKERRMAREIQEDAEGICRMILDETVPDVDIEIAKGKLAEKVSGYFPDKLEVYRMIYEARFARLWAQFRKDGPAPG